MAAVDVGIIVTAVNNATAGIREIKGEVEGLGGAAQETANRLKAIQVVLVGIALDKVRELTKSFVETAAGVQTLQTRLALITGDWQKAGEQLDAIIERYEKVGVSGKAVADVFLQFRGIGQNADEAERLANAIALLNAGTDRTPESIKSLGDAMTKVLAKGSVDMRALITVMASQFPEAIRAAATAAGASSVNAFVEMAKAGEITGRQFAEFFRKGVEEKFGGIFNLTGGQLKTALDRFTSAWESAIRKLTINTNVAEQINSRLNHMAEGIEHFVASIKQEQIDKFFDALDNGARVIGNLMGPMGALLQVIGAFSSAVLSLLAQLPGEVLAFGIVGYLFYGRAGAVVAVGIGNLIHQLDADLKTNLIGDIMQYMGSNEAFALGLIGYIMFGPLGALALSVIGAKLAELRSKAKAQFDGLDAGSGIKVLDVGTSDNGPTFGRRIAEVNQGVNVFDLIKQKAQEANLNIAQTAALIAHAKAESDLGKNPVGDNGHSFGLFQFNDRGELKGLMEFAEKAGKDWKDYGVQIDYVIQKAQNGSDTFSKLWKAASSPQEASRALDYFERFKGYLAEGNVESAKRIALAAQYDNVLGRIAQKEQVPVGRINEPLSSEQQKQYEALQVSASEINKQIDLIRTNLRDPSNIQAVEKVNAQFENLKTTLDKNIGDLDRFAKTLNDQPDAQKRVIEQLDQEKQRRDALIGLQTQQVFKEKTLAEILMHEQIVQQQILRAKADEQLLTLKTQYSNNAAFNILAGTSGGQIAVQTEQQRLQLQQQILQYEQQIDQLEQQRIRTNDPLLQQQIDTTIAKYKSLQSATQLALQGLSAESVAARQMWQAVGQTIENGAVSAITTLVTKTGTLKDVQIAMYNALTQAAAKYIVQLLEMKAIMPLLNSMGIGSGFGGFFGGMFANGGVFSGSVKPFANGGIIGGPTLFGIAGEASKEAIMPLEQVNGKLGVRAIGHGVGGPTYISLNAIDTQTGTEFLLKNLNTIQAGLSQRRSLNRAGRLGNP